MKKSDDKSNQVLIPELGSSRAYRYLVQGIFIKKLQNEISMTFNKILRGLDRSIGDMWRRKLSRKISVNSNTIMFMTYQNDYTCNPKYITEEIIRRKLPYRLVWAIARDTDKSNFPSEVELVLKNSFDYFCEIASSKVWVDNAINFLWEYIPKKKEQVYFNTWHGSLGLKRVGKKEQNNRRWYRSGRHCAKDTDYMISNSDFEDMVYRDTYWPGVEILQYGHARNDILFKSNTDAAVIEIKQRVYEYFNLDQNVKLFLYAPTFRKDKKLVDDNIDYDNLLTSLHNQFGGEWVILVRQHFHLKKKEAATGAHMHDSVLSATAYPDMQELMVAASIGVTDYSSWICDFMLTSRPGFIYAPDLDTYDEDDRGFYYPLDTTPFPISKNSSELIDSIHNFDRELYNTRLSEFLKARGCIEDGHASERIVDKIVDVMNK